MASHSPERRRRTVPRDQYGAESTPNPRKELIAEIERRWLVDLLRRKPYRDTRHWPPSLGE